MYSWKFVAPPSLTWHAGHVVRRLREYEGWTQVELGRRAGTKRSPIGAQTIIRLEQTGKASPRVQAAVAKALGLTWDKLLGYVPTALPLHYAHVIGALFLFEREVLSSVASADPGPRSPVGGLVPARPGGPVRK